MIYELSFTDRVIKQISIIKKSDVVVYSKLHKLFVELMEHPRTGTGKPEIMKYNFEGYFSRRITRKHRLVYKIDDERIMVEIIRVSGHYDDK